VTKPQANGMKLCRFMLLSWDCIIKKKFLNLPVTYYLTADRMSLVSPASSNGWTIPLREGLGRSKPATNPWNKHKQHNCGDFYYIQALLNRLLQNKMRTTSVRELGYLFLTMSFWLTCQNVTFFLWQDNYTDL
jgi:hypothetical protein